MTVIGTGISWTNSTWNWAVGCNKISAGCDNCYASALVHRMQHNFGHKFEDVRVHPNRLQHVNKFKPITGADGLRAPHLVFTNSMSDWAHEKIPTEFVHQTFDVMEQNPGVIFQMLTKRPVRARQLLVGRYGNSGIPANMWIGTTVESNDVAGRADILRSIQDRTGPMTAFLSVEPIVGPTDKIDFTGLSWIITGGESGSGARLMQREWLMPAIEQAKTRGIALWHKQSGQPKSHPNWRQVPPGLLVRDGMQWLVDHQLELLAFEKGGATVDGKTYRELPPHFHQLKASMNPQGGML